MEKFDERKKSFEKKFAHDEELKFKVSSRRNKYLGQWASQKLGYDVEKEKEYIRQFNFGDVVEFDGHKFELAPDHNDNVKLVEVGV